MFSEAFRVLKPGGKLRVTCPNIDLYTRAYLNNDRYLFGDAEHSTGRSLENLLLYTFASQLSVMHGESSPTGMCDQELAELFRQDDLEGAYTRISEMCDFEKQRAAPGDHINWWSPGKVRDFWRRLVSIRSFTRVMARALRLRSATRLGSTTHCPISLFISKRPNQPIPTTDKRFPGITSHSSGRPLRASSRHRFSPPSGRSIFLIDLYSSPIERRGLCPPRS